MAFLVLGLAIFLGAHSLRILAPAWRDARLARLGESRWKAAFSIVSAVGLALLVWGYGQARGEGVALWAAPTAVRHAAAGLMLPSFVLLVAAYVPGNRIKAAIGHPMVAGTALWALAHLLANGRPAALVLFGSFLAWTLADFVSARGRDRAAGRRYRSAGPGRDAIVLVAGTGAWAAFAFWGHAWLIGVAPLRIG